MRTREDDRESMTQLRVVERWIERDILLENEKDMCAIVCACVFLCVIVCACVCVGDRKSEQVQEMCGRRNKGRLCV